MPKPNKGESEDDFVSRCIPIVMHEGNAKNNSHAAAKCYGIYREHHAKKRFKNTYKED